MGIKLQHDVAHAHARHVIARGLGREVTVTDFRCLACRHRTSAVEEYNIDPSIVFVRRGLFVRSQAGDAVVADTSQILFFNPQQPYRISHPIDGGDDCTILTVSRALALEIVARHAPRAAERSSWLPFVYGHCRSTLDLWRLHYEIVSSAEVGSELALDDLLLRVLDRAVRDSVGGGAAMGRRISRRARTTTARRHKELAHAAMVSINRNLACPPTLTGLATALGCSTYHLSHVFREVCGSSLRSYLAMARARAAADAIARGFRGLTELALQLGYVDHSHFTKAFRKEWRVSPSAFRQNLKRKTSFAALGG